MQALCVLGAIMLQYRYRIGEVIKLSDKRRKLILRIVAGFMVFGMLFVVILSALLGMG